MQVIACHAPCLHPYLAGLRRHDLDAAGKGGGVNLEGGRRRARHGGHAVRRMRWRRGGNGRRTMRIKPEVVVSGDAHHARSNPTPQNHASTQSNSTPAHPQCKAVTDPGYSSSKSTSLAEAEASPRRPAPCEEAATAAPRGTARVSCRHILCCSRSLPVFHWSACLSGVRAGEHGAKRRAACRARRRMMMQCCRCRHPRNRPPTAKRDKQGDSIVKTEAACAAENGRAGTRDLTALVLPARCVRL